MPIYHCILQIYVYIYIYVYTNIRLHTLLSVYNFQIKSIYDRSNREHDVGCGFRQILKTSDLYRFKSFDWVNPVNPHQTTTENRHQITIESQYKASKLEYNNITIRITVESKCKCPSTPSNASVFLVRCTPRRPKASRHAPLRMPRGSPWQLHSTVEIHGPQELVGVWTMPIYNDLTATEPWEYWLIYGESSPK